mgnify:CR=1 FL=1
MEKFMGLFMKVSIWGILPVFLAVIVLLSTVMVKCMKKDVCTVCGYVYDPEKGDPDNGIAPGTAFEDIPEDWCCPECGAPKDSFSEA